MWIVDDTTRSLLVDIVVLPMGLWVVRGTDATRGALAGGLGTSVGSVPRVRGGGPQPLPSADHSEARGDWVGGSVRPSRHGSSGSVR